MNKKAFLGTVFAIIFIAAMSVGLYVFFDRYDAYDEGITFDTIGDGGYKDEVDGFDLMLLSFLRTKKGDFTIIDHIRLGNSDAVEEEVGEVFGNLCRGKNQCAWAFVAEDFGVGIGSIPNDVEYFPYYKEAVVEVPVLNGDNAEIRLVVYARSR